ncbi:hypothetical protein JAAARDRAFT_62344 [Jaapia argillacea MUCL 33604]|uniref:Uncharacterized protein n=1 Tax=Jaapia argillacea MUCL 33604 TaxID=933084 RepID=A0A067PMT8_9AGAM|nr:hypothetical protein JAAARDRAFT_62344 [Jaapia argillacea MUCL 33604]
MIRFDHHAYRGSYLGPTPHVLPSQSTRRSLASLLSQPSSITLINPYLRFFPSSNIQSTSWTLSTPPILYYQSLRSSAPTRLPSFLIQPLQHFRSVHALFVPSRSVFYRSLADIYRSEVRRCKKWSRWMKGMDLRSTLWMKGSRINGMRITVRLQSYAHDLLSGRVSAEKRHSPSA